jgi:hypothetical protein
MAAIEDFGLGFQDVMDYDPVHVCSCSMLSKFWLLVKLSLKLG